MDTREVGPFRSSLLDIAAHGTFLDTRAKMKLEETQPNVGFGFLTPNQSNGNNVITITITIIPMF